MRRVAAGPITSSGPVTASVTFVAGNCIDLQPGFQATAGTAGTTFHAWVETAPTADSVSPASGNGLSQAFTWKASSPSGYTNLSEMYALFNTSVSGLNACYIRYNRAANLLYLADNSGSTWLGGFVPGTSGTAGNSQCSIAASGSSASGSGPQLTLTVSVTFQTAFSGPKSDYLIAYDQYGLNSAWQQMGTWTVPTGDTTPPVISNLQHSPASDSATVTWTTNELSDTQIEYGLTPSYGSWTTLNPTMVTSHSQTITGLQPSTGYYYQARSRDAALNLGTAASSFQTASGGVQHTITTSPLGLSLTVDGTPYTSPCVFQWTPGTQHTLATTTPQAGGGGTQYVFSNWSDGGAISHSITASSSPATYTANFTTQYTTLEALNNCIASPSNTTCMLAAGTYTVTAPIDINRSNITVTGSNSDRTQTKLVRDLSFTGPLIRINAPSFTVPGITLQNFTVCGGLDRIRDIHTQSDVSLGTSSVGCPRQQTTPGFTSGSCGDMLRRITRSHEPPDYPPALPGDFQCTDVEVQRADTGQYQVNPFPSTSHYSLTIANLDLEDAAGHALSLFEVGTPGSHINDIYIHHSAINGSAVTGIVYGNNIATYHTRVCDTNPNWLNDQAVFAPRNLRIENSTFANNHTGAMGGGPVRWVGLRNNTFTNNFIHPQVGNEAGGTIEFDPCADKFEITGNQVYGPSVYAYDTEGLELYARNLFIQGNTISGYPVQGVSLYSVFGANVTGNLVQNNNTQQHGRTGGIAVATTESITGPCGDPRESRDVTISNNTVPGQLYGVYLSEHDSHSTATLRRSANPFAVALAGSDLNDQVGRDGTVFLDSYSGPTASVVAEDPPGPRALTVQAVSPVTSRCSTGMQPQTFAFPARHTDGGSHIRLIEVVFSISGDDKDGKNGPDNGAGGCHLAYFPQYNLVYLDGPNGGSTWSAGSSVVGPGGIDLNNGYCTIHAGWTPAPMPEPYISPFISHGVLVIEFPPSSTSSLKKHIYTVVQDDQLPQGRVSDGGTWKYWGWWATQ